jgi:hypothetical protein
VTDFEFDIIDELYFVTSFDQLLGNLQCDADQLKIELKQMLHKGWIKCFEERGDEIYNAFDLFDEEHTRFFYLATKTGLQKHTSL